MFGRARFNFVDRVEDGRVFSAAVKIIEVLKVFPRTLNPIIEKKFRYENGDRTSKVETQVWAKTE